MASQFEIDETSGGLTALDALATPLPDPQPVFNEYREKVRLANGSMRGLGPQTVTWSFPLLEVEQIEELEAFFDSSPIYIRTRKRNDDFAVFEVIPNVPDPKQDGDHLFQGIRSGYTVEFIILSEVP